MTDDTPSEGSGTTLEDLFEDRGTLVVIAFVIGGVLGAIANPNDPVAGFLVIGSLVGGTVWLFATESGKEFRNQVSDSMNQTVESTASSAENRKLCDNCGWKNPVENDYCHDCGTELG